MAAEDGLDDMVEHLRIAEPPEDPNVPVLKKGKKKYYYQTMDDLPNPIVKTNINFAQPDKDFTRFLQTVKLMAQLTRCDVVTMAFELSIEEQGLVGINQDHRKFREANSALFGLIWLQLTDKIVNGSPLDIEEPDTCQLLHWLQDKYHKTDLPSALGLQTDFDQRVMNMQTDEHPLEWLEALATIVVKIDRQGASALGGAVLLPHATAIHRAIFNMPARYEMVKYQADMWLAAKIKDNDDLKLIQFHDFVKFVTDLFRRTGMSFDIPAPRKAHAVSVQDEQPKKIRIFHGDCHFCGMRGHRERDCRNKREHLASGGTIDDYKRRRPKETAKVNHLVLMAIENKTEEDHFGSLCESSVESMIEALDNASGYRHQEDFDYTGLPDLDYYSESEDEEHTPSDTGAASTVPKPAIAMSVSNAPSQGKVLIDSGANVTLLNDPSFFTKIVDSEESITLFAGQSVNGVEGKGPATLVTTGDTGEKHHLHIRSAMYYPTAPCSVLSERTLTGSMDRPTGVTIRTDHKTKTIFISGAEEESISIQRDPDGLFYLPVRPADNGHEGQTDSGSVASVTAQTPQSLHLWHLRFAHLSVKKVRATLRHYGILCRDHTRMDCDSCLIVKTNFRQNHQNLNNDNDKETPPTKHEPGNPHKWHLDLLGPIATATHDGRHGCFVFTAANDASNFRFARVMTNKKSSSMLDSLRAMVSSAGPKYPVRSIHTDGDACYTGSAFIKAANDMGIDVTHSVPYRPQSNQRAELNVKHVKQATNTSLVASGLEKPMWSYAVAHSWRTANLTYNENVRCSPYEYHFQRKPKLQLLRAFGCPVYFRSQSSQNEKIGEQAQRGIFICLDMSSDTAIILNEKTGRLTRSDSFTSCETDIFQRSIADPGLLANLPYDIDELGVIGNATDLFSQDKPDTTDAPALSAISKQTVIDAEAPQDKNVSDLQLPIDDAPSGTTVTDPAGQGEVVNDPDSTLIDQGDSNSAPAEATAGHHATKDDAEEQAPEQRDVNRTLGLDGPTWSPTGTSSGTRSGKDYLANTAVLQFRDQSVTADQVMAPLSWKAALASPMASQWQAAAEAETASLLDNDAMVEIAIEDVPRGAQIIGCTTVLRMKTDSKGQPQQCKVRFCALGNQQKKTAGENNSSPVTPMATIRLLAAAFAPHDFQSCTVDYKLAYINAKLKEPVYMRLPEGYKSTTDGNSVLLLKRSLYGLRESGQNWYRLISARLKEELGMLPCDFDPCLFVGTNSEGEVVRCINLYVDDILARAKNHDILLTLLAQLKSLFKTSHASENVDWFLGTNIDHNSAREHFNMSGYLTKLSDRYDATMNIHDEKMPLPSSAILEPRIDDIGATTSERLTYASLIGALLFATVNLRFDVATHVSRLAQFVSNPAPQHQLYAERVLRYLISTKDLGISYYKDPNSIPAEHKDILVVHCDADLGGSHDARSTAGIIYMLNGFPFAWTSKKLDLIVLSTTEAELCAATIAVKNIIVYRGLLKHIGLEQRRPTVLHTDSQSGMRAILRTFASPRVRHLAIKLAWLRQQQEDGVVIYEKIDTKLNKADCLTKVLTKEPFLRHRDELLSA